MMLVFRETSKAPVLIFTHWRHSKHVNWISKLHNSSLQLFAHYKRTPSVFIITKSTEGTSSQKRACFSSFMPLSDKHVSFKKPPAVCICALWAFRTRGGKRETHFTEENKTKHLRSSHTIEATRAEMSRYPPSPSVSQPSQKPFRSLELGWNSTDVFGLSHRFTRLTFTTSPNDVCKLFYKR